MAIQSTSKTCFLCNDSLFGIGAKRVNSTIPLSETTLTTKIEQLLGDNFMIVVGQDDKLCIRCYNLLVKFDELESDLDAIRRSLKGFLNIKYNLENFSDNIEANNEFCFSEKVSEDIGDSFMEESEYESSQNVPIKMISEDVQIHRVTSSASKYACSVCDFKSTNKANVLAHLRSVHKSTVAFKCATCDKRFASRTTIQRHIARAHGVSAAAAGGKAIRYRCGICSATYPSQIELVDHFRVHREQEPPPDAEPQLGDLPPPEDFRSDDDLQAGDDLQADDLPVGELADLDLLQRIKSELDYVVDGETLDFVPTLPGVREIAPKPSNEFHECSECGFRTSRKRDMREHAAAAHQRRHECPLCSRLLSSGSNLRRHLERHDAAPVKCRQCKVMMPDRLHLRKHIQEVHPQDFRCLTCQAVLPTAALLRLHEASHGAEDRPVYPCTVCGKALSTGASLRRHELTHDRTAGPQTCAKCDFSCADGAVLRRHLVQEHGVERQRQKDTASVPCDKCTKVFPSERRLKWHKDLAHRPPGCKHCGKVLTPVRKLIAHERRHLVPMSRCPDCDKTFKTPAGLLVHSAVHTGRYRFVCTICGKGSQTVVVHDEHVATHTKESLYTCERCGRGFSSNSTLRLHRVWHDNPFPYSCSICQRKFRHSSLVAVHKRRVHTGERPYKCPHCPLTFSVSGTRKKHVILHTRKFPHRCSACGKGFTTRGKLARHLARTHDDFTMVNAKPPQCEYKMVLRPEEMNQTNVAVDSDGGSEIGDDGIAVSVEHTEAERVLEGGADVFVFGLAEELSA